MAARFKRLLVESPSIKISQMSEMLGIVRQILHNRLNAWKEKYGIKIDGEYMITSEADVARLIEEIVRHYANW